MGGDFLALGWSGWSFDFGSCLFLFLLLLVGCGRIVCVDIVFLGIICGWRWGSGGFGGGRSRWSGGSRVASSGTLGSCLCFLLLLRY